VTLCTPHWNNLKKAIDDKGLLDWISKDLPAPHFEDLSHNDEPSFGPLMRAACALWLQAWAVTPAYLSECQTDEDYDKCLLCALSEGLQEALEGTLSNIEHLRNWVEFAASQQLDLAREKGLAAPLQ
jgi:hypothetical protein